MKGFVLIIDEAAKIQKAIGDENEPDRYEIIRKVLLQRGLVNVTLVVTGLTFYPFQNHFQETDQSGL